MTYERTQQVINNMKHFYENVKRRPHTEGYFDLASTTIRLYHYKLIGYLNSFEPRDIQETINFFKREYAGTVISEMSTDMDTIDATYTEITEVWDIILNHLDRLMDLKMNNILVEKHVLRDEDLKENKMLDFDKTVSIINAIKTFYTEVKPNPVDDKPFALILRYAALKYFGIDMANIEDTAAELNHIDPKIKHMEFTLEDAINTRDFFYNEAKSVSIEAVLRMNLIDATYSEVSEVWDYMLDLVRDAIEQLALSNTENHAKKLVDIESKPKEEKTKLKGGNSFELVKVYKVTFLRYSNLSKTAVRVGDENIFINLPKDGDPFLIREDEIPLYSMCGGGIDKLEFVGYVSLPCVK